MTHMMLHFISPTYTHEKLVAPSYRDLVDIFEDRMRNWLLEPAKQLLTLQHGVVAAVGLSLSYFEGIEIYCSGHDSGSKSKDFFRRGFQRVFKVEPTAEHVYEEVVNALYIQARCGFAHDGLFRNRVFFSDARPEALNITWPRKNGEFIKDGHLESVVINPQGFFGGIECHFTKYVSELRAESDAAQKEHFLAAIDLKWGLNEPDHLIAMPKDEFLNRA
jgi:hypothetical protein